MSTAVAAKAQALLAVLQRPDDPAFIAALTGLQELMVTAKLAPQDAAAVLAALERTLATLQAQHAADGQLLTQVRQQQQALKAYGGGGR